MNRNGARHAGDVLFLAGGADGHLLQVQHVAGAALFQNDVVIAQLAVAQVGPHQQALQGFFRWQRAIDAWRRDPFGQFGGQPNLPARDGGKGIQGRDQRLPGNRKRVVAHVAGRRLLGVGGEGGRCYAGHQDGGGQQ